MRHLTSGVLCLTLAVALVAGALSLCNGRAGVRDRWVDSTVFDEVERAARLAEEDGATLRRIAAKNATLREAAARFRDSDASVPESYRAVWRLTVPGRSDEERYCRQVLTYVGWLVPDRGDEAGVLVRLRAELDEAMARGDLRLPD
jgi:hypothetical protein